MSFDLHRDAAPFTAASNIQNLQAVTIASGGNRQVAPVASCNVEPFGLSIASAVQGLAVSVHEVQNYVAVTAAASVGRGGNVGVVGATNSLGPVAAASGSVVYRVGVSVTSAAAGEEFTVFVNPRQLSGLA